jgi:Zn-dependent peptidase ImmA (M78 family)
MKIPADAFRQYVELGDGRSYEKLAQKIGVSKRSIVVRATSEKWQEQLRGLEARAKAEALKRLELDAASVHERHVKAMRVVQARALEVLRVTPLDSAIDAVRALALAQREERALCESSSPPPASDPKKA